MEGRKEGCMEMKGKKKTRKIGGKERKKRKEELINPIA